MAIVSVQSNWLKVYGYPKHGKSLLICDMIKGNESGVGNIDFELQALKMWQILNMFYTFFEL